MRHIASKFRYIIFAAVGLGLTGCDSPQPTGGGFFPEVGEMALHQRALDLKNDLNVLSIAMEPGSEDIAALAWFRMHAGARVVSAYFTNGESGESDISLDYPEALAGHRREEAFAAAAQLDSDVYFLNLPHLAAARDTGFVRRNWATETMRERLVRLLQASQPDIILLPRDKRVAGTSPQHRVMAAAVLDAVARIAPADSNEALAASNGDARWSVDRVFVYDADTEPAFVVPTDAVHPLLKLSYRAIGDSAWRAYRSLNEQSSRWPAVEHESYRLAWYANEVEPERLMGGLPKRASIVLRGIERDVLGLADKVLAGKNDAGREIYKILDAVNLQLSRTALKTAADERALLHWKKSLDDLRSALHGVEVEYVVSDTAITPVQLTYLTIKSVKNLPPDGNTSVIFGSDNDGWVVNELLERKVDLDLNEPYRLLSPKDVTFNTPHSVYAATASQITQPLFFFVVHRNPDRSKSFIHRSVIHFSFAPRFLTEVLTPVVRIVPGEFIRVRLKNFSRDGVVDTLRVDDELAGSTTAPFRLSNKEDEVIATLYPYWKKLPNYGDRILPLKIADLEVAAVAARVFPMDVDTTKRIGVIPALAGSALHPTLRRMAISHDTVDVSGNLSQQIANLDVLIVDRRALTFLPILGNKKSAIDSFVRDGGHLIVLAQDADTWSANPLLPGVQLSPASDLDTDIQILAMPEHALATAPNMLSDATWVNWINRRAYNQITVDAGSKFEPVLQVADKDSPVLITGKDGEGRRTYIDLALSPQLLNVHEGTFRLFANVISVD